MKRVGLVKKASSMVLAVVMLLAVVACSKKTDGSADTEKDPAKLKVGVVMKSFDEFQQQVMDGAVDMAQELGIPRQNVTLVAPNNEAELLAQAQLIEDLISKGVNILVVAVNQEDTLMNQLNEAHEQGIKIVFADTNAPNFKNGVTYIGTDNLDAAYQGALEFSKQLNPGSNVVILRGKYGDPNHDARTNGLQKALEENGHKVLEALDANCEVDKAAAAMESWLTKFSNQINAVMVTSDSMAVGAAQAIKGAGIKGIKICGFDGFQSAISLIPSGEISMIIAQKPYFMGQEAVKDGFGALSGTSYPEYINPGIAVINNGNYQQFVK
jgi:ribose transport system substrate-binding protein